MGTWGYSGWAEVKLDRAYNIRHISMTYGNGTGNYTHTLKAGLTENPSTQIWSITEDHAQKTFDVAISGLDDARFVRLNSTNGTNWIGWTEIGIYKE